MENNQEIKENQDSNNIKNANIKKKESKNNAKKPKEKKPINKATLVLSIVAGIITLVLIASIFVQFRTVDESKELDLEGLRDDELRTQIASYKSRYEETMEQYNANQNTIREYETAINENKETTELLDQEIEQAKTLLGLTNVRGSGVVVTLTDTEEALYTYIADDLILLINELKYAGAEAISINDNRIVNLSDIVTLNDGLIILYGNVRLTSPYVVKAIGDPTYLMSTLSIKNSGYIDQMKANGMAIEVKQDNNIEISAYTGEVDNRYLKEVE